jgi:hypothetical protein
LHRQQASRRKGPEVRESPLASNSSSARHNFAPLFEKQNTVDSMKPTSEFKCDGNVDYCSYKFGHATSSEIRNAAHFAGQSIAVNPDVLLSCCPCFSNAQCRLVFLIGPV